MAKRRKLEAPSAEELTRYEAEFQAGAPRGPLSAPIAQVAAETAEAHDPRPEARRIADAKDRADAERLRDAEARGLVIRELALDEIADDAMVRDRMVIGQEEFEELKLSIVRNGLRTPVEVFDRGQGAEPRWGLLSGYRRLMAYRALREMWKGEDYTHVPAVVRDPEALGGAFAAMVEENEIRTNLSHYERGRIAVLAAQNGAFGSVEEAVNNLFPVASKAKRSKIRSFALVFEELGDLLAYPEALKETVGLKLAGALREGNETALRDALSERRAEDVAQESELLAAALAGLVPVERDPSRGGRPRKTAERAPVSRTLDTGVTLKAESDAAGWYIRLSGQRVDRELVEVALRELERLLGPV